MKKYVFERTNKAELRPEEESEKVDNCRGNFGLPYLGKATAPTRAVLPVPNSACGIFVSPNKGTAASA